MKESRHRIILQELDQTGVVAVKNLKENAGRHGYDHPSRFD